MVDPNVGDGGYLDYNDPDWNSILAQVSCIWVFDPTSDNLRSAGHYFQIYDDINRGTVAGARYVGVFWESKQSPFRNDQDSCPNCTRYLPCRLQRW